MANQIEFFVKMNRVGLPSDQNALLPVRLRPVFYEPNLEEQEIEDEDSTDELDDTTNMPDSDTLGFFRDPLRDSDINTQEEQDGDLVEDSFKLGRNMRASNVLSRQRKDVHELMNARNKLLQHQKDQQVLVEKEFNSEKAATVLVNSLVLQGYNVSGLENTAKPQPFKLPPPEIESPNKDGEITFPIEKEKLIGALHQEMKRVHRPTTESV